MVYLCSGKNKEGYLHALIQSFELSWMPVKSSLSKYRNKISFLFFKEILFNLLNSFNRPKWRGLHLYATDGFEMTLPRTQDIVEGGYKGRRLSTDNGAKGETYYPHMYTVHTYDILSRTTKAFYGSIANHETKGAVANIKELEPRSMTLYDRAFCNSKIINAHFEYRSFFFIRFKSGKAIPKEIQRFIESNKTQDSFLWEENHERRIYLFKIKNKKQKQPHIYATNYKGLTLEEAEALYRLRWEVETGFRDLVNTLAIEQWHSKTENGILQEIYVRLWIINYARIQQFQTENSKENPLKQIYKRSNFKLILDFIINHWADFFARKRKFLQKIKLLIKASTEKRKRYSRSVKRQLRYQNKNYPAANIVFDPEVKVA